MGKRRPRIVLWLLVVAAVAWLAAGALYLLTLIGRQVEGDLLYCRDRPLGSSNYGHAAWQWWYPGTRCTYDAYDTTSASVRAPSAVSGVAAAVLVVWPVVLVAAGRRYLADEVSAGPTRVVDASERPI